MTNDTAIPLKRLIAFTSANNRLDYARRQREQAEENYRDAEREFRAAWDAMTPQQQAALNTAFEVDGKATVDSLDED